MIQIFSLARPEYGLSEDEHVGSPALDVSPTPDSPSPNESAAILVGSVAAPRPKVTYCACGRENKRRCGGTVLSSQIAPHEIHILDHIIVIFATRPFSKHDMMRMRPHGCEYTVHDCVPHHGGGEGA